MPEGQQRRHVGLALIEPLPQGSLFQISLREELLRVLNPNHKVERYRRIWRLSKIEEDGSFLCGKLGFFKNKLTEEMFYDERMSDFVTLERDSREGAVSHFVLHIPSEQLNKAILAFVEHPPDIRRQSFIGAFSKFLVDAHSSYEVKSIRREIDFITWLDEMDRITEFSGTFKRPNPRWRPRTEQVQEIIEQTHADSIKLIAKAGENSEGLAIGESILGGIVEHSQGGRYGSYTAKGISDGSEFNYHHGSSEIIEEIIEEVEDTTHDIFSKLIEVIQRNISDLL